ncbi:MAG: carboxymuconolactone decarboxylase family protein [Halioglobus sp.]|nr:carboxymuconolactone decarboxylase family protein [Halioglobus sp.]
MAHMNPLPDEKLGEFLDVFAQMKKMAGFVPNSLKTMARRPGILRGYMALAQAVMLEGEVDVRLKRLAALMSSTASGCRYCQAHMTIFSSVLGVSSEELMKVYEFELDDTFSAAEKAVLRLARDAGLVPNAVTDEHFVALREHFDEAQIVEIIGAIALFGFLNRWNDTMATELEAAPMDAAQNIIGSSGWSAGKHAG